jgi:hypothetical protein
VTDRESLDDLLRDALAAEAERAKPAADAGPALASRARTARRRRSAALVSTAAIVVAALFGGGLVLAGDDAGGDAGDISVDTTPPTGPAPTTPTSAPPTPTAPSPTETAPSTSPSAVSDQTTPTSGGSAEEQPFFATDAWPLPDPRPAPPEQIVAVTEDGRLVVVDTATGAEVRELAHPADPRVPDEEGPGPNTIDGLDVSPDGELVWFSTCCEPISGAPYRVPLDGSAPEAPAGVGGYAPDYGASARYVANVTSVGIDIEDPNGDFGLTWRAPSGVAGNIQAVAWSLDGRTAAITYGQERRLALLDVTGFLGAESETTHFSGHVEPVELPGDGWALPSFARDGSLVVAHVTDGLVAQVAIDVPTFLATGELVTADLPSHEGIPVSQDHDATGEWLVVVEADDDGVDGGIHWFGPDGSTGVVPGSYRAAAW